MFDFSKVASPFFCDDIIVSGDRDGKPFSFSGKACVTSADLLDASTGAPCGDRAWSVVVRFSAWLGPDDPRVGDAIRVPAERVDLKISRVERDTAAGEYSLTCLEIKSEVRRGLGY